MTDEALIEELRPAVDVWREAYWTWANDPSFGSNARSVAIIEADRAEVERLTVARIVEWLTNEADDPSYMMRIDLIAKAIEAGEWKP